MTYMRLVAVGMVFAFLVAGLAETFLLSSKERTGFRRRGVKGSLEGLTVGPAMTLCSACIVPVADSFRKRGASVESTIALAQGSSTLNLPAILMTVAVFTPMLAVSRICLSVAGALLIGPAVAYIVDKRRDDQGPTVTDTLGPAPYEGDPVMVGCAVEGDPGVVWSSFRFFVRLAPIMVIAGFASGLAIQWLTPDSVSLYLGDHLLAIAIAATVGVLINVPLMFEIPLVAAMMLLGMGTAPAATLLFAAAAAGPITFWGLAKHIPVRGVAAYAASTWILAALGGVTVLGIGALLPI